MKVVVWHMAEVSTVLVTQEIIVTGVDTQLAVCFTQISLEQMTMLAFLTGDIEQSVVMSTERGLVTKGPQVMPSL